MINNKTLISIIVIFLFAITKGYSQFMCEVDFGANKTYSFSSTGGTIEKVFYGDSSDCEEGPTLDSFSTPSWITNVVVNFSTNKIIITCSANTTGADRSASFTLFAYDDLSAPIENGGLDEVLVTVNQGTEVLYNWYADVDGDGKGYGVPLINNISTPPPGRVDNDDDECPNQPSSSYNGCPSAESGCGIDESEVEFNFTNSHLASETISQNVQVIEADCQDSIEMVVNLNNLPDWIQSIDLNTFSETITVTCTQNLTGAARSHSETIILEDLGSNVGEVELIINQSVPLAQYFWYNDSDGDTYGDYNSEATVSVTSPFSGAVNNNLDYCPFEVSSVYNGCLEPYENINWTRSKAYDRDGNVIGNSKSYFNDFGKGIQSQTVDIKTQKTWASQTLYDTQGRPALSTLSAPINNGTQTFLYKTNFIKKPTGTTYTLADFESNEDNPETVGNQSGSLGWYYSESNTNELYQDITNRPYSRAIYSNLNPGSVLKTIGGNKVDTDLDGDVDDNDAWLQAHTFTMPASDELAQSGAFNSTSYNAENRKIVKTIARDIHGVENVVFTDTDGKTLAAARTGNASFNTMTIKISQQGYVDIHVPVGTTGFTINGISGITTKVHDLITEVPYTGATSSLENGFYRVSITNLEDYNPTNFINTVTITYKENYYDYSLNAYDDAGRLISSKQPLNHLETTFKYNAQSQLIETTSPDEGTAKFKYRRDGQIRFSQSTKQTENNTFSYTNYDELSRPIESGVCTGSFNSLDPNANTFSGTRSEQNFTTYDYLSTTDLASLPTNYNTPQFLSGNVAKTTNSETTSYYSYDVYGRVQWVVQDINQLGIKTIDYIYDNVTSAISQVIYQKHNPAETFVHRYTYHQVDNSLIKVETATSIAGPFTIHAEYNYYETGSLKNVILAEGLQQTDYVYNLSGQLKGINHPQLTADTDPGANTNDMFGMTIDYYDGDYLRNNIFNQTTTGTNQYNGNIKGITWNTGPELDQNPVEYSYEYNRNNWLEQAQFNGNGNSAGVLEEDIIINTPGDPDQTVQAGNSITFMPGFEVTATTGTVFIAEIAENNGGVIQTDDYKVHGITYDANGNIQTLNRNKNTENGSNGMDELRYTYDPAKPNQLNRVEDDFGDAGVGDLDNSQLANNYVYNSIGQLIENHADQTTYEYNAIGLVTQVNKDGIPRVKFYYNDKGHRVKKESILPSGITTTVYVRDAAGTPLAIYEDNELVEHTIYGANRLGVHKRQTNTNVYQLTDHLGNVRAVIIKNASNAVSLTAKTDYYPFGMPMPNRNVEGDYRYKFQGQEKDSETGMEAFELRLWDGRIGRWLTTDPMNEFSSPYLGMGNNPIRLIDPDGGHTQDDYLLNEDGSFTLIAETNFADRVFNDLGSYLGSLFSDTGSSFVNLEYDGQIADKMNFHGNTSLRFENDNISTNAFEFFAKNSEVEWSQVLFGRNSSFVATSHSGFSVGVGWGRALLEQGFTVRESNHSHPTHIFGEGGPSGYTYVDGVLMKNTLGGIYGDYAHRDGLINGFTNDEGTRINGFGERASSIKFHVYDPKNDIYTLYGNERAHIVIHHYFKF